MTRFERGDRVQLSHEALLRRIKPRVPSTRQGTVRMITTSSAGITSVHVRWHGRSSDEAFHESYLDLVERPQR